MEREKPAAVPKPRGQRRAAFTLVEMLTTIFIISILVGLLMPAVNAARSAARKATCQNNLRQFGVELHARAERTKVFCSGGFDWLRDGSVTDVSWVADLVNTEVPVGQMLCPANTAQISEAYNDLLAANPAGFDACLDRLGSPPREALDGTIVVNPCRQIVEQALPPETDARRVVVQQRIFDKLYNTNFAASWFLIRTAPRLDKSGNLITAKAGCNADIRSLHSTLGPLSLAELDAAKASSSAVPLLGDARPAPESLVLDMGPVVSGSEVARSMTGGPLLVNTLQVPSFNPGTPQAGVNGWYNVWVNQTRQDYRALYPVHSGVCNVLFADGSVRTLEDKNRDGLLNNGFPASPASGFADADIEIVLADIASLYSLRAVKNQ